MRKLIKIVWPCGMKDKSRLVTKRDRIIVDVW